MAISTQPDADKLSPSERVVQTVAVASNTAPLDLPPLYQFVDPDALDDLINELNSGDVRLQYAGHVVTVYSDGTIDVSDTSDYESKRAESATDD